jgi:hypothetical protein
LPDEFVDKTVSEMVADDLPQLLALRAQPFWAPVSGVDRKRGGADVFSRVYGRWDKVARWQELSGSASSRLPWLKAAACFAFWWSSSPYSPASTLPAGTFYPVSSCILRKSFAL